MMENKIAPKIGSWPTPEEPRITPFEDIDIALMKDLTEVYRKHGFEGTINRIEFTFEGPIPEEKPKGRRCFRYCYVVNHGTVICTWICPY